MCAYRSGPLRAPEEAGGGGVIPKKTNPVLTPEQRVERILTAHTNKLMRGLEKKPTPAQFLELYSSVLDGTKKSFDLWAARGDIGEMSMAQVEQQFAEHLSRDFSKALSEVILLRMGHAFKELNRAIGLPGVRRNVKKEVLAALVEGKSLRAALNSQKVALGGSGEIKKILTRLGKENIQLIDTAVRADIVNNIVVVSPSIKQVGVAGWVMNKTFGSSTKQAVVKAMGLRGLFVSSKNQAAFLERFGAGLDKRPQLRSAMNSKALFGAAKLAFGAFVIYQLFIAEPDTKKSSGELPNSATRVGSAREKPIRGKLTPVPAAVEEAKNKELRDIFFAGTKQSGPIYYCKENATRLSNLLDGVEGLSQAQKKRAAQMLFAFLGSAKIPDSEKERFYLSGAGAVAKGAYFEVLGVLQALDKDKAEIGRLAMDIVRGFPPHLRVQFAKDTVAAVRRGKTLYALYESPPAKYKVTKAWQNPHRAFEKAGFAAETPLLSEISLSLRKLVPKHQERNELASLLAKYYFENGEQIPKNYADQIGLILELNNKGLPMAKAFSLFSNLDMDYPPRYLALVLEPLAPSPAERDKMVRGLDLIIGEWAKSKGGELTRNNLKELAHVQKTWGPELAHLSPEKRADVLIWLHSKVKPKAFASFFAQLSKMKNPTSEQILSAWKRHLRKDRGAAL